MKEIVSISRFAPSWTNTQTARYTLIDDEETIQKLATDGVNEFVYNIGTLKKAKGVAVLSYVQGKSGRLPKEIYGETKSFNGFATTKANEWEAFDAGIACQTFCLAAYAKGVGTCILGVIDEKSISEIINLPENETVAALIVYGYADGEVSAPKRKNVEDILRFHN